jgi:hypothetical protein
MTVGPGRGHRAAERRNREAAILLEDRPPAREEVVQEVRAGAAAACLRPASKAGLVPTA